MDEAQALYECQRSTYIPVARCDYAPRNTRLPPTRERDGLLSSASRTQYSCPFAVLVSTPTHPVLLPPAVEYTSPPPYLPVLPSLRRTTQRQHLATQYSCPLAVEYTSPPPYHPATTPSHPVHVPPAVQSLLLFLWRSLLFPWHVPASSCTCGRATRVTKYIVADYAHTPSPNTAQQRSRTSAQVLARSSTPFPLLKANSIVS